jgi:hypothetical protein
MPVRWCSPRASGLATAALWALAGAVPAVSAATVLDRRVTIDLRPDGTFRQHTEMSVRLDGPGDLERWADYPVYLDDHVTLVDAQGAARHPGGELQRVKRRHRDEVASPGDGVLHDSARYLLLQMPGVRVGTVIEVDTTVDVSPYFPADSVSLLADDRVERLRVEVRGAPAGLRWHLDGPAAGLSATATAGGVVVTGTGLEPPEPLAGSPDGAATHPDLRSAWGEDDTWAAVGRWFERLTETLPRGSPAVAERARRLVADDRRATLEALTGAVQQEVRYVAVEVGVGGFRPSPPQETLDRRWGDCKDKALLLIDMLAAAGIPAHPALALASDDERIDRELPSPTQFNHLIVAVPATAVAVSDGDAVAGGYLFVDPTQPRGGGRWLAPGVQGQDALVALPGGGELVRLPVLAAGESIELTVDLAIDPAGDAAGRAALRVRGSLAEALIDHAGRGANRGEEALRSIFSSLLPGSDLGRAGWTPAEGPVPEVELTAVVAVPRLLQVYGERVALTLPALRAAPEPRLVTDRTTPLVVAAGVHRETWRVTLPAGCSALADDEVAVDNEAGGFRQTLTRRGEDGFTLERTVELGHRWYGPELLADLGALSVAEHRAHRRRLQLACTEGWAAPSEPP